MSVLQEQYKTKIAKELFESGDFPNVMQVPKLEKLVISSGIGTNKDREVFKEAEVLLSAITGQKPVATRSRKNIAGFKLREGQNVGLSVTLRGKKMYDFVYRLINIALPRVRDFRGVSGKAFDGFGNYSLGITDQSIFTETNLDKMKHTIGMNIAFVTNTGTTNEDAYKLLELMGMPFAK